MEELYYLLDLNGIYIETEEQERDRAIRNLLRLKKRKAIKHRRKVIQNEDIINEYKNKGIVGIKKFFKRNICYLYSTEFVYNILFYHYKADWRKLELIIKHKIKCREN